MDIPKKFDCLERYCRKENYAGFCKFDALNSPFLEAVFGFSPLTRLLVSQAVNRIPLPLRSLFGVRKLRNPKGIANFIRGYCALQQGEPSSENLVPIRDLADWLLAHHSHTYGTYDGPGLAWGYGFPWQSPGFYAPRHAPNCIVTTFCGEALLAAYRATGDRRYLEGALGAKKFLLEALPVLEDGAEKLCLGYVQTGLRWKVININAVAAGFLAKLARELGDTVMMETAKRLIAWVLSARTEGNAWNYTEPKSQSGIGPDNYHTGGILDGFADYLLASGDVSWRRPYEAALEFYRSRFFASDGAPKWRVGRLYPNDIHGAAQGILTFTKASAFDPSHLEQAAHIAQWALLHMQDPVEGFFYYQKFRSFTWKLNLMRWNNSWMLWALGDLRRVQALAKSRPSLRVAR